MIIPHDFKTHVYTLYNIPKFTFPEEAIQDTKGVVLHQDLGYASPGAYILNAHKLGLGNHFVMGFSGEFYNVVDLTKVGNHARSAIYSQYAIKEIGKPYCTPYRGVDSGIDKTLDHCTIGITLVSKSMSPEITPYNYHSLVRLLAYLLKIRYPTLDYSKNIYLHSDLVKTLIAGCPVYFTDVDKFKKLLLDVEAALRYANIESTVVFEEDPLYVKDSGEIIDMAIPIMNLAIINRTLTSATIVWESPPLPGADARFTVAKRDENGVDVPISVDQELGYFDCVEPGIYTISSRDANNVYLGDIKVVPIYFYEEIPLIENEIFTNEDEGVEFSRYEIVG